MALESISHSEDKEKTRHSFELLDSGIAVIGVDGDVNDSSYKWNLANSSIEN